MYLLEGIAKHDRFTVAVSSPRELFSLIIILDSSDSTTAWRIVDHEPTDFGWSPHWEKYAPKFLQEHYAQSN
jgi:hypothetical protein